MAAFRCLIADDLHPVFAELLDAAGVQVRYRPELSYDAFLKELSDAEILVLRSRFLVSREVLAAAPSLKIIARAGAGLDGIDAEAAVERGVAVLHAAEGNADAVAEHVTGMLLSLLARIPEADRALRSGIWNREAFRGRELKGLCVGIIGYGNMGPAVASRLQAFGCRIIAYDKYRSDWPDSYAERVSLAELQEQSDVISLHVPLTAETNGMVNHEFLLACRRNLILINTSRGPVLDPEGLSDLLDSGQLSGLALDVFPEEPLFKKNIAYHPEILRLIQRPDVLCTPHVAGWTSESYRKISEVLARKVISLVASKTTEHSG